MQLRYVWDPFIRIFHWSLVIAFCVAFYTHASEWDRLLHIQAGYVAGGLMLSRIIWGIISTGYANFRTFPLNPFRAIRYVMHIFRGNAKHYIGHNPTGALVIYAMLAIGLTAVISGFLVYNDGWLIDEPELLQALHHYSTWGWLILVSVHVSGVIFESVIHKDNLIWAMITGCKRVCKIDEREKNNKVAAVKKHLLVKKLQKLMFHVKH
ncbi:MAG: cytochrome b/b6 domain-containing protein [Methylophilus sp.]